MSDTGFPSPHPQHPTPPPPPFAPVPPASAPQAPAAYPGQPAQAYPGAAPIPAPAIPAPTPPQQGQAMSPMQYAPAYPAYGAPIAPPRPTSGLAITSLVCGIAGVVLFWALIPLLASIVAVITGHMALRQLQANPALGGRGLAIAGLIMGYIMTAMLIFGILSTVVSFVLLGAFTLPFIFAS